MASLKTANLSIGQDKVVVTPLQMAVTTSAIANGGKVFWPRLVAGWETLDPILGKQFESTPKGRLRAQLVPLPGTLPFFIAMLQDVEHPLDLRSAESRVISAGKPERQKQSVASMAANHETWFVSYAPHDHPRYAVVVLVDDGISVGLAVRRWHAKCIKP